MSLSRKDSQKLRDSGFTNFEIEHFGASVTPEGKHQKAINLDSPTWQAAMKSRRRWVDGKILKGEKMAYIMTTLDSFYHRRAGSKSTPWDFIKAEYKPTGKIQDYRQALLRRKRTLISRRLGGAYRRGYA